MDFLPVIEIIRVEESQDGSFGVLRMNKQVVMLTLELPGNQNAVSLSSIPAKQYLCKRIISPTFGETFEVTDVPGRSHILFHKGNTKADTKGCILVGQSFGLVKGHRAITGSSKAFSQLMQTLQGHDAFHLTIKEEF